MRSLTFRLTFWYALVVTLTVGAILWAGRFYLESHIVKGVDFINDAEYEEIFHRLKTVPADKDLAEAIRLHTEIDASLFFFQVSGPDKAVLFRSANMGSHSIPHSVDGTAQFSIKDDDLGHLRVGEYAYNNLTIHIASSLAGVDTIFSDSWRTILQILFLVCAVSVGIGLLLSRIALNPIRNIQSIARRIGARNLSERIPVPPGGDEITELSKFLNKMFDRLEAAFQQISRFTADASHELRTPLSLIRLHSEKLIQNPDLSRDERVIALAEQMNEIDRLNKLIDDLLFIAKADAGVFQLSRNSVDSRAFIDDFSDDAKLLCEEKGLALAVVHNGPAILADIDPGWMRHVLLNLLSNAMRYTLDGGTITLYSKTANPETWELILEDEGPGLPEEALTRIFERFHRHTTGKTAEYAAGTGLGLAICQSIVQRHEGRIIARNRDDRTGLQVCILLNLPQ